jgi:hypothetical protein
MAKGHQEGTGICHGGKAGLGEKAHISALIKEFGKGLHVLGTGVLVELVELQAVNMPLEPGGRQEPTRRAELLHHKAIEGGDDLQDGSREHPGRVSFSQGSGYEV